jgi:uncharacterized protein
MNTPHDTNPQQVQQAQGPQQEWVAFLASGAAFGGEVPVHIQTHISHLFLVGDRAYKMKRAVLLNFADLSTLEKRLDACQRELVLNRRTAPDMYLGYLPINRNGEGFTLGDTGDAGASGEAVDYVVEMQRFRQEDLFKQMADEHRLTRPVLGALAEQIIALHQTADQRPDMGGQAVMRANAADVHANLTTYGTHKGQRFLAQSDIDKWYAAIDGSFARHGALMDRRRADGHVRQCHGDLHLGNICLFNDAPTLFDCIEFSDELACIDVLYDLAFLVMDLVFHGLHTEASLVFNRYLSATRDYEGLPLMAGFLSLRAAIRAMVSAIDVAADGQPIEGDTPDAKPEARQEAADHLALALTLAPTETPPPPRLIAIGGLSGSGKSTIARQLAPALGPGTVVLSTDVIRKRLHGVSPETTLPKSAYTGAVSGETYGVLFADAAALAAGQTLVADATFVRPQDRDTIADIAANAGAEFTGLWLDISEADATARVASRGNDPSDADVAVVASQHHENTGTISWHRLDAMQENLLAAALNCMESDP